MFRFFVVCLAVLIQSGCGNILVQEEQVQKQLERFESVDANMYEPQQELLKLEGEEKQVYEQLVTLRLDNQAEMKSLADEANELLEQRKKLLEKEKRAVKESKEAFQQVEPLIHGMSDEGIQREWEKMKEVMTHRYTSYEELYNEYDVALKEGGELYRVFLQSPFSTVSVENQIKKIDEQYKRVAERNHSFNNWTDEYHKERDVLYEKIAGNPNKTK
ncbi:YkyA family protein [Priestia taiwanensis]|uniref:Cell-wall binding lipoprotein n=1 Tax=Priestia taiwanensis TaxID=1347902 RepID=A0A917AQI2_9BACI|nr:YkyA family protein [Priestia taiwanensis]MBM7363017.1 alpha-L-arabinofuranosidase [Priestia taiwanensis]GGE66940.1 hypothetical protein GCM10007140_16380 [Priestia taiwanensis]